MSWDEHEHPRAENGRWIARLLGRMPARLVEADVFYHGTTEPDMEQVRPATEHRRRVTFPSDTDPGYGYATSSLSSAWHYAELAWNASSHGIPRVYRVRATGPVEEDPMYDRQGRSRSIMPGDVRSRHPFEILDELPTPDHFIEEPDDY